MPNMQWRVTMSLASADLAVQEKKRPSDKRLGYSVASSLTAADVATLEYVTSCGAGHNKPRPLLPPMQLTC